MLQLAQAILKVSWFIGMIFTFFDARQRMVMNIVFFHFYKFVDLHQE